VPYALRPLSPFLSTPPRSQLLMHPGELESLPTAVAVLGVAGAMESYTLSVAFTEVRREAKKHGMSIRQYLVDGPDPLNPAVLLEDSVAVVGVGVAAGAIALTHVTGNPMYDAAGSIAVGSMMGAVALFIINRNRKFLGGTVPRRTDHVVRMARPPCRRVCPAAAFALPPRLPCRRSHPAAAFAAPPRPPCHHR
jgi:hypothetical protein